jgi:nitrite reductase/ring-hydroxylating ferredoxin subunit
MPQYKTTLKKSDFQEGKLMKSEIGDKSIVIGMIEDKLYAMDSVCSHGADP